jgi:hypothetical protein
MGRVVVWDPRLLWATLSLVAALLLGALILALMDRWRKHPRPDRLSANEQLAHFRALFEQGEISSEEYERLHALLKTRLIKELPKTQTTVEPPSPPVPKSDLPEPENPKP